MGRAEAFAMKNTIGKSFLDGLGNSIGYGIILMIVAFFREVFGTGTIFGVQVVSDSFIASGYNNGLMLLAPGAFIVLGLIIWIQRSLTNYVEE